MAREQILKRKREAAALMLQSYFRSTYQRARYVKHIDKVKMSTFVIIYIEILYILLPR